MVKFLIRWEGVTSAFQTFDDHPLSCRQWKSSFISLTKDLELSPRELFLLVKWLGLQSARQARRIRSAHVHNPAAGLHMTWKHLGETFGAPAANERALLKKMGDFPRISNKDNLELQELGDFLLELHRAFLVLRRNTGLKNVKSQGSEYSRLCSAPWTCSRKTLNDGTAKTEEVPMSSCFRH